MAFQKREPGRWPRVQPPPSVYVAGSTEDYNGLLLAAAAEGDRPRMEKCIERDADPNCRDDTGRTPLSLLFASYDFGIHGRLVDFVRPRFPQVVPRFGSPPLKEALDFLIGGDADLDIKDYAGRTPLSHKAEKGDWELVKLILEKKPAQLLEKDTKGRTPLSWAAGAGEIEVVCFLLETIYARSDDNSGLDDRDKEGRTPLSHAAGNGQINVVKFLLNKTHPGPDHDSGLDERDNQGRTPLSWAARNGQAATLWLLLQDHNADAEGEDNQEYTPFAWAVENGHKEVARLLIYMGKVVFHTLVRKNKKDLVEFFLDENYDVGMTNATGQTVLHIACFEGHIDMVRKLIALRNGSNPQKLDAHKIDDKGDTCLDLAIQQKHQDIICLLFKEYSNWKGIAAQDLLKAYKREPAEHHAEENSGAMLRLSKGAAVNDPVSRTTEEEIMKFIWDRRRTRNPQETHPQETHLFLLEEYPDWKQLLEKIMGKELLFDISKVDYKTFSHSAHPTFSISTHYSVELEEVLEDKSTIVKTTTKCVAIIFALTKTEIKGRKQYWESVDYFSTLPYGWIPTDTADFFAQYIRFLLEQWSKLCDAATKSLKELRNSQLRAKGAKTDFVDKLAAHAAGLSNIYDAFKAQLLTANQIASKHFEHYPEDSEFKMKGELEDMYSTIESRFNVLDQTVRDLLQFEFAWVTINEAHRSMSIAVSMKRLSWITFIFLPAMFASSLFGMNVDVLKENPHWQWYLLFGGGVMMLTFLGWLTFKYFPIEAWVEKNVGWGKRSKKSRLREVV